MKKTFDYINGLPGGPNEVRVKGSISVDGYKLGSKDINNDFNIIKSGDITMQNVPFPVMGIDNLGNSEVMMPGANYTFPGNEVFEIPLQKAQDGNAETETSPKENLTNPDLEVDVSPENQKIYNDVINTTLEYLQSDVYLQRLRDQGYEDPEGIRDARIQGLNRINVTDKKGIGTGGFFSLMDSLPECMQGKSVEELKNVDGECRKQWDEWRAKVNQSGSYTYPMLGNIEMDLTQIENAHWHLGNVLAHEIGHNIGGFYVGDSQLAKEDPLNTERELNYADDYILNTLNKNWQEAPWQEQSDVDLRETDYDWQDDEDGGRRGRKIGDKSYTGGFFYPQPVNLIYDFNTLDSQMLWDDEKGYYLPDELYATDTFSSSSDGQFSQKLPYQGLINPEFEDYMNTQTQLKRLRDSYKEQGLNPRKQQDYQDLLAKDNEIYQRLINTPIPGPRGQSELPGKKQGAIHDIGSTEAYADLVGLRYWATKTLDGWTPDQEMTQDLWQKLMTQYKKDLDAGQNNLMMDRMIQRYGENGENIINIMNTVADATEQIDDGSNTMMAKFGGQLSKAQNGKDFDLSKADRMVDVDPNLVVPIQDSGRSREVEAFGYTGYFDFDTEPILMDNQDGQHFGYLFTYTTGPTAGEGFWRPIDSRYMGSRWEDSGQIEEYEAYFKNLELIDKHWGKDSKVGLKIKEAVTNNVPYNQLPEYLKDVNTWRTISPNRDLSNELQELDELKTKQEGGEEVFVSYDDLEKGIKAVESLNGELMINPFSTATGFYGQRFSEIEDIYDGTRDDFAKDTEYQQELFVKRYNGEIEGVPGLQSNGIDVYNEYKDQIEMTMTPTEVAALSHFLGRDGARKYFGYHIRDGKSLSEALPKIYGDTVKHKNKTPEQYIELFRKALAKKLGGATTVYMDRLMQQLDQYEKGGRVSQLAIKELTDLGFITPKMQKGGSYTVKKGDYLSTIINKFDNSFTLEELLQLNPKFKGRIDDIYPGEEIILPSSAGKINEDGRIPATTEHTVKKGETLSEIAARFGASWRKIAEINNIEDPKKLRIGSVIKVPKSAKEFLPKNEIEKEILEQEKKLVESPYNEQEQVDPEAFLPNQNWVSWDNVKDPNIPGSQDPTPSYQATGGLRQKIHEINKQTDQIDVIVNGENQGLETSRVMHPIEEGENLSVISRKYNVSIKRLMEDNDLDSTDIRAGDTLVVNKSSGKPYIILDEKMGSMHLYYPGESTPAKSYPILTGLNEGDAQTVTKQQYFDPNGQPVDSSEAFESDGETLKQGFSSTINWDWGNKTTGAGVYTISDINQNSGFRDVYGQYAQTPSIIMQNDRGDAVSSVIHAVTSDPARISALETPDPSDNRISNGCINGKCSDIVDLVNQPDVGPGSKIYVLSDSWERDYNKDNPRGYEDSGKLAENRFVYQDGKVVFKTSKQENEKSQNYLDVDGISRTGQGINRSINTLEYKPINFVIDKEAIQNSNVFDGSVANEELEFKTNTKPFVGSIIENKQGLMERHGISNDLYNDLAMLTFGIYGAESRMGDLNSGGENFMKLIGNTFGVTDTGPDTSAEWDWNDYSNFELTIPFAKRLGLPETKTIGKTITGDNNSVGHTQIVWSQLDADEKSMLAKEKITSNDDLQDPANSAVATLLILSKRLNNSSTRIKSPKIAEMYGAQTETYIDPYGNEKTRVATEIVDGKVKVVGEDDPNVFVKAKTVKTKDKEVLTFNIDMDKYKNSNEFDIFKVAPSLWNGDAGYPDMVSRYMKLGNINQTNIDNVDPKLIEKGEFKGETASYEELAREGSIGAVGQKAIDDIVNWWENVDLNPFYDMGGEFNTKNQERFYNDYINGIYKNTNKEEKAKKIFDKLNTLYYNDAKDSNMHQYDVIRSINKQS